MWTDYKGVLFLLLGLIIIPASRAEGLHGEFSVGHGYLFRGLQLDDSQFAWRVYLEYAGEQGLYAGLWAGSYAVGDDSGRNYELNFVAGFSHRLNAKFAVDTMLVRYVYPGADSYRNYDWTEWVNSVHLGSYWMVSYAISENWLGADALAHTAVVTFQYPLPWHVAVDFSAGIVRTASNGLEDYSFQEMGFSKNLGDFALRISLTNSDSDLRRRPGSHVAGTHASLQLSWIF